jgi:hypothetical protein
MGQTLTGPRRSMSRHCLTIHQDNRAFASHITAPGAALPILHGGGYF